MSALSQVASGAHLYDYAEIAMMLFFGVFFAVGIRAVLGRRDNWGGAANLPLDDGQPVKPAPSQETP